MKIFNYKFIQIVLFFSLLFLLGTKASFATTSLELNLKTAIEDKSKDLQEITKKIEETQNQLFETQEKGITLKQAVKKTDTLLNQINLNIKSSEIKIDKLGLELENLSLSKKDKENKVLEKKTAIEELLREIMKKGRGSSLRLILESKSISQSILDSKSIEYMSRSLASEVNDLELLKNGLVNQIGETAEKKHSLEGEKVNLKYKKNIAEDEKNNKQYILSTTKSQEKLYQAQLRELERKQEEIAAEVEAIESELRLKIDPSLLPSAIPGVLLWPVQGGYLTQGYGSTAFALKTYRGKHHNGIDIGSPIGTPVYSAEDGEIVFTANQDSFCRGAGYGKVLVVKHDNNLTTLYGHLSQYSVRVGQKVKKGEVIGYMGKTGWATGPHLHFVVFVSATYYVKPTRSCGAMPVGGDLDPTKYVSHAP
ncbi:MAG: hypothetical protein EXS49_00225 [Candidatus Pacebacteria bacterium]|nr:hypothetical protein [Candidatus Paceibacterota bacterium]